MAALARLRRHASLEKPGGPAMILYTFVDSPIDPLMLTSDGDALTGLYMSPHTHAPQPSDDWRLDPSPPVLREAAAQISAYFAGELSEFHIRLHAGGTEFQHR